MITELSESVQVQIIVAFGLILSAIVTTIGVVAVALINRTRQHARAASNNTAQTRDELKNDHKINLRDDLDRQFAKLNRELKSIRVVQADQARQQITQGRQIGALFKRDRELADEIEHTRPPIKKEVQQ